MKQTRASWRRRSLIAAAVLAMVRVCSLGGAGAIAAEPAAGTPIVHPVDGAVMVYVPAGEFTMGLDEADVKQIAADLGFTNPDDLWAWEAFPKRTLTLPGYFIDKCEVTVERWERFAQATGFKTKSTETSQHFGKPDAAQLPAGEMKWADAKQYAVWAGKALPTEPQWEKAARGTDGRLYPWGNKPPTLDRGHFGAKGKMPPLYVAVGGYPTGASPCGALDLLGNQYEWTADNQGPYPGNPRAEKMIADGYAKHPCLRGGSWYHGWVGFYAAKRFGLEVDETYYHIGFRTVWTPPPGYFESAAFAQAKAAVTAREAEISRGRALATPAK